MESSDSEDIENLCINNTNVLFSNQMLRQAATNISPRLVLIYDQLSNLFNSRANDQNNQFLNSINKIQECLTFTVQESDGPICNRFARSKKFFCFDCQIVRQAMYCEDCFDEKLHEGHYFIVDSSNEQGSRCDCGNENLLKKESCCPKHRNFTAPQQVHNIQLQKYIKQIEFMLYIGLRIKKQYPGEPVKYEAIMKNIFVIIIQITQKSYINQIKIATLLLNPFSRDYQFQIRPVIQILFSQKWSLPLLQILNWVYCSFYPVKSARKKILMQLMKIFNSNDKNKDELEVIFKTVSQFGRLNKSLIKMIQQNIMKPLAFQNRIVTTNDNYHRDVYLNQWYVIWSEHSLFPQMIELVIRKVPIGAFYNFQTNNMQNEENRRRQNILVQLYMNLLRIFVTAIQKLPNKKEILIIIIRSTFNTIFQKQQKTIFCAEKTLGLCILSYLDYDFANMNRLSLCELKELVGSTQDMTSVAFKLKAENILKEYNISMFNQNKILQLKPRIALNYAFLHFLTGLILKINQYSNERVNLILNYIGKVREDTQRSIESIKRYTPQMIQNQSIIRQLAVRTGVGIVTEHQKLCYHAYAFNKIIRGLVLIYSSHIHQVLLASLIMQQKLPQITILQVYRQLAYIHYKKTPLEFSKICQKWIKNEEIWQMFMDKQYHDIRKMRQNKQNTKEYWSCLNCDSEFTEHQKEEIIQRYLLKNKTDPFENKWGKQKKKLFSQQTCEQLVAFYRDVIVTLNTPLINIQQQQFVAQYFTHTAILFLGIYQQLKYQVLKVFLDQVFSLNIANENYKNTQQLYKILENQLQSSLKQKQVIREENPQPETNSKKQQKILEIKQKQQKYLAKTQEVQSNAEDTCIICKQTGSEKPLKYLCRMKLSSVLNESILKVNKPIIIITTCGHMIHDECLADNIQDNNQYADNYKCFFCQTVSNLRLSNNQGPFDENLINQTNQQLLTILSIELEKNPKFSELGQKLVEGLLPDLLVQSLVYQIFLYCLSDYSHFETKMLSLFSKEVIIIKQLLKVYNRETIKMVDDGGRKELAFIFTKVIQLISSSGITKLDNIQKYIINLIKITTETFKNNKQIIGFQNFKYNFFKLPNQLYELTNITRKCQSCLQLQSKLFVCCYCGLISCIQCKKQNNHQMNLHNGVSPGIDLCSGELYYESEAKMVKIDFLYKNTLGEGFEKKSIQDIPKRGVYKLDRKVYEQLIEDSLLEYVKDNIEEKTKEVREVREVRVQGCSIY